LTNLLRVRITIVLNLSGFLLRGFAVIACEVEFPLQQISSWHSSHDSFVSKSALLMNLERHFCKLVIWNSG